MWGLLKKPAKNANDGEISFFDVKELYDAAYAEKAKDRVDLKKFQSLMSRAMRLDQAYRLQLATDKIVKHARAA